MLQINDVYIPRPFRGYAFVTLNNSDVAIALLRKRQFFLGTHSLFVNPAAPKLDAESPPQPKGKKGHFTRIYAIRLQQDRVTTR